MAANSSSEGTPNAFGYWFFPSLKTEKTALLKFFIN